MNSPCGGCLPLRSPALAVFPIARHAFTAIRVLRPVVPLCYAALIHPVTVKVAGQFCRFVVAWIRAKGIHEDCLRVLLLGHVGKSVESVCCPENGLLRRFWWDVSRICDDLEKRGRVFMKIRNIHAARRQSFLYSIVLLAEITHAVLPCARRQNR